MAAVRNVVFEKVLIRRSKRCSCGGVGAVGGGPGGKTVRVPGATFLCKRYLAINSNTATAKTLYHLRFMLPSRYPILRPSISHICLWFRKCSARILLRLQEDIGRLSGILQTPRLGSLLGDSSHVDSSLGRPRRCAAFDTLRTGTHFRDGRRCTNTE